MVKLTTLQNDKIAAGLSEKEWFHGVLPREEVVRLLVNDGDFLVRETMRHEERQVRLFFNQGMLIKRLNTMISLDCSIGCLGGAQAFHRSNHR